MAFPGMWPGYSGVLPAIPTPVGPFLPGMAPPFPLHPAFMAQSAAVPPFSAGPNGASDGAEDKSAAKRTPAAKPGATAPTPRHSPRTKHPLDLSTAKNSASTKAESCRPAVNTPIVSRDSASPAPSLKTSSSIQKAKSQTVKNSAKNCQTAPKSPAAKPRNVLQTPSKSCRQKRKELASPPSQRQREASPATAPPKAATRRGKSAKALKDIACTSNAQALSSLQEQVKAQSTVLKHDLKALEEANDDNTEVINICKEFRQEYDVIENQRYCQSLVAQGSNPQSHYDEKLLKLIKTTTETLTKLKRCVNVPEAWSRPTHGLPLLPHATDGAEAASSDDAAPRAAASDEITELSPESAKPEVDPSDILNKWYLDFHDCPYATQGDVAELAQKTGLAPAQVRKWLGNRRLRDKTLTTRLRKSDSKKLLGEFREKNQQKKKELERQRSEQPAEVTDDASPGASTTGVCEQDGASRTEDKGTKPDAEKERDSDKDAAANGGAEDSESTSRSASAEPNSSSSG